VKKSYHITFLVIIILAFALGFITSIIVYENEQVSQNSMSDGKTAEAIQFKMSNEGFTPLNVSVDGSHLTLGSNCYAINFDVTEDQAFSIQRAIEGTPSVRPLTQDLIRDVLENYQIRVFNIRIERFDNDIYYARMFLQQDSKVLDMDIRPSDAIAIALRTNSTIYANQSMLKEKGTKIC
jgi:bifunctional DNase/RNase